MAKDEEKKISEGQIRKNLFLTEEEIENRLRDHKRLQAFWKQREVIMIIRSEPTPEDPVYEIQLALDLGDRLETYAWVWAEALEGKILKIFPED